MPELHKTLHSNMQFDGNDNAIREIPSSRYSYSYYVAHMRFFILWAVF